MKTQHQPKFHLGQIVATPGAIEALDRNNSVGLEFIRRHVMGDWGFVDEEDKKANDRAVENGDRILSAYFLSDETKLWVITEAVNDRGHRAATTLLLPEEY